MSIVQLLLLATAYSKRCSSAIASTENYTEFYKNSLKHSTLSLLRCICTFNIKGPLELHMVYMKKNNLQLFFV